MCRRSRVGWRPGLLLLLGVALLAAVACGGDGGEASSGPFVRVGGDQPDYLGVLAVPPPAKPDAVLTDTAGGRFDLRKETEGYVTLLFFGYTHCPDVCPTQMLSIATALERLPAEVASRVKVLFVTTDPGRDTPGVLREWLDAFDPSFVGLYAGEEDLAGLQEEAGMAAATTHVDGPNTAGGEGHTDEHEDYAVVHGDFVLAFTPGDNLAHTIYPLDATADVFAHDLQKLVTEGWQGH